jgi:glucoamylase
VEHTSRVWYTLDASCVTEVYYPTIDTPQIVDLQFLFTDGETFFHDERRNFTSEIDCITEAALGFEVTNRENDSRYTLRKTILGDPYQNCLLIHVRVDAPPELLSKLKMYVLCAPHLEIGGWHNNGENPTHWGLQVSSRTQRKYLARNWGHRSVH